MSAFDSDATYSFCGCLPGVGDGRRLELSETVVALGRMRKDLEDEGNYESAAVADLLRDRVADEQKMRASKN